MREMNIRNKSTSYSVSLMALICGIGCAVALVLLWSVNSTTGLANGKATKRSEVPMYPVDYMSSGSIRNAPPEMVALTIPWDSKSTVSLRNISAQQGNGIVKLAVPPMSPYNNSMLSMIDYANLETDVVINVRKLVEDAMDRNPHMSSGAVLDLMLEQIEEDVLDGWDPDANK
jgi:hypothetical protein